MRSPAAAGAAMSALIRDVIGPPACTNATLIAPCPTRRRATEGPVAAYGDRALTRLGRMIFASVPCPRSLRVHPQLRDAGCPKTSRKSTARAPWTALCRGRVVALKESRMGRAPRGPERSVRRARVRYEEGAPVPQPSRGPRRSAGWVPRAADWLFRTHESRAASRRCFVGRSRSRAALLRPAVRCPAQLRSRWVRHCRANDADATSSMGHRPSPFVPPHRRIRRRRSGGATLRATRHQRSPRAPRLPSHARLRRQRQQRQERRAPSSRRGWACAHYRRSARPVVIESRLAKSI